MGETNKNVVITKTARMKLVRARAGEAELPHIAGMAFGNGGVNADGGVIKPSDGQSELAGELYRKPIDKYSFPTDTTCRYECTLRTDELVGEEISEVGLYDEEGDIVRIKNFTRKGKDDDVEQTYVLDDIF